jgi:polyisoprenoid-binding protein YceI
MKFNPGKLAGAVLLVGLGVAMGAPAGVTVYKKLHPPARPRPDQGGGPGGGPQAPPELPPGSEKGRPLTESDLIASKDSDKLTSPGLAAQGTDAVPVSPVAVPALPAKPPDLSTVPPPEGDTVTPLDIPQVKPAAVVEFFGVPVEFAERPAAAASTSNLLRLRLMKDRCVGGFDGKSSVLDFSGWTRALTGELTYEKGRLAETAKGVVTADAATLDTGDADRDKEIREKHLESAKYPTMSFEIASIRMTSLETMDMTGAMEIHGVKKTVTIPCSFKMRRDGFAWMKGEVKLNMTEFGITPPVKMGVIKVADEFRIWFEIWAEPVKEPKK